MEDRIRDAVDSLVGKNGTRDPFALCRALDIVVYYAPLAGKVRALTYRVFGKTVVCLDERLNDAEQTVVLAHELGHCVLHPDADAFFLSRATFVPVSRLERQADRFARLLLAGASLDLSDADPAIQAILLP